MSNVSSPAPIANDMAAPQPQQRHGIDPNGLTPRSKVKAMLAAFDDDSESSASPKLAAMVDANLDAKTAPQVRGDRDTARTVSPPVDDESDDSDDVVVTRRPKGRLAARLHALPTATNNLSGSEDDEPAGAYTRVRQQLVRTAKGAIIEGTSPTTQSTQTPSMVPVGERRARAAVEEVGHEQLGGHRRPARSSRVHSQEPTMSPRSSPGLFVSPYRQSSRSTDVPRTNSEAAPSHGSDSSDAESSRSLKGVSMRRVITRRDQKYNSMTDPISAAESDGDEAGAAELRTKLTQQTRPTRKSGKKALEDMQRETQRLSRNMQLAYQEKTRKRFSTKDLFGRFRYQQPTVMDPMHIQHITKKDELGGEKRASVTHGQALVESSDVDAAHHNEAETPPTSPLSQHDLVQAKSAAVASTDVSRNAGKNDEADLPTLQELMSLGQPSASRGKDRCLADEVVTLDETGRVLRSFRVKPPEDLHPGQQVTLESDDEILPQRKSRLAVFDNVVHKHTSQSQSLSVQRALAHVTSSGRVSTSKRGKGSAMSTNLLSHLRLRAHQQAIEAKRERIESLRAKGIYIETEEEKVEREEYVANSLQKAREDAILLAERERRERKQGGDGSHHDGLDMLSSDEDEEWLDDSRSGESGDESDGDASGDAGSPGSIEPADLDLSGSSDEGETEVEDIAEVAVGQTPVLDTEEELKDTGSGSHDSNAEESEDEIIHQPGTARHQQRRRQIVLEDDEGDAHSPTLSGQDETFAAFGFDEAKPAPITMTQMFAGTMADLDSRSLDISPSPNVNRSEESLAFLRQLPSSMIPDFSPTVPMSQAAGGPPVPDSQIPATQTSPVVALNYTQSDSQRATLETPSRFSEAPDPTQDPGFLMSQGPVNIPQSTTDTVLVNALSTPGIPRKKGRLVHRHEKVSIDEAIGLDSYTARSEESFSAAAPDVTGDAFRIMQDAAIRTTRHAQFDKQKSGAREMMDEQAEESEDEYAGIGGVSEDEFGEEDEEDRAMIDNAIVKVDERKIAALHAEQDRIDNERRVNQLYNDITTGALRRRRGGELELSDDEDDVAAERRRRKQREFARRTKALLSNEKIGELAEHTRKQAFLHALADREEDEDSFNFLDVLEDVAPAYTGSQPTADDETVRLHAARDTSAEISFAATQPAASLKRAALDADDLRTDEYKRPRTQLQLKKTISDLVEDPVLIPDSQLSSDDDELRASNNVPAVTGSRDGSAWVTNASHRLVRDRLALAQQSDASTNAVAGAAAAFHRQLNGTAPFKVPSLLRRTTTNLSTASTTSSASNSAGMTRPPASEVGGSTKRGGSRKSNIHYQVREAERRRAAEEADQRRKDGMRKKIVGRASRGSVLGQMFTAGRQGFD